MECEEILLVKSCMDFVMYTYFIVTITGTYFREFSKDAYVPNHYKYPLIFALNINQYSIFSFRSLGVYYIHF